MDKQTTVFKSTLSAMVIIRRKMKTASSPNLLIWRSRQRRTRSLTMRPLRNFLLHTKAGYGDHKNQKNSMMDIFTEALMIGEKYFKFKRSVKVWQKSLVELKGTTAHLWINWCPQVFTGMIRTFTTSPNFSTKYTTWNTGMHIKIRPQCYPVKQVWILTLMTHARKRRSEWSTGTSWSTSWRSSKNATRSWFRWSRKATHRKKKQTSFFQSSSTIFDTLLQFLTDNKMK